MNALLFFILGIGIAWLYLSHLRLQLRRVLGGGSGAVRWSFPVRFALLAALLGLLFAWDAAMALYAAAGMLAGRFALLGVMQSGGGGRRGAGIFPERRK